MGRLSTNLGIGLCLASMTLTGLPTACAAHEKLRDAGARCLTTLGIAQPRWRLFGPDVHKLNSYIVAEAKLADGSSRKWTSPDWSERSTVEKLVQGQLPKFYDNLRRDRNRAAWRPFAEWVAREVGDGETVVSIRLERRFWEIPAPGVDGAQALRLPREAYPGRHVFYERRFQ